MRFGKIILGILWEMNTFFWIQKAVLWKYSSPSNANETQKVPDHEL